MKAFMMGQFIYHNLVKSITLWISYLGLLLPREIIFISFAWSFRKARTSRISLSTIYSRDQVTDIEFSQFGHNNPTHHLY